LEDKYTKEDCIKLADIFYPIQYYPQTDVRELSINKDAAILLSWLLSQDKYDEYVESFVLSLRSHKSLTGALVNHAQCHDQLKKIIQVPFDEVPLFVRSCKQCPYKGSSEYNPSMDFCGLLAKWRFECGR
jgi:hypothetical protein